MQHCLKAILFCPIYNSTPHIHYAPLAPGRTVTVWTDSCTTYIFRGGWRLCTGAFKAVPVYLWTAFPPNALMWRRVVLKCTVFAAIFNQVSHCKTLHCWSDAWFNNAKTTFPLELTTLLKSHSVLSLYPHNECNIRTWFFASKKQPHGHGNVSQNTVVGMNTPCPVTPFHPSLCTPGTR